MPKPKTTKVVWIEGEDVVPFVRGKTAKPVHAVLFDDGSRWDSYNGWNSGEDMPPPTKEDIIDRLEFWASRPNIDEDLKLSLERTLEFIKK